jgi:hypothetical protein
MGQVVSGFQAGSIVPLLAVWAAEPGNHWKEERVALIYMKQVSGGGFGLTL